MNSMIIQSHNVVYNLTEGCLYYRETTWSDLIKIYNWENGLRTKELENDSWSYRPPHPDLILIDSDQKNIKVRSIAEFMKPIPQDVVRLALQYQYNQISVLKILRLDGASEFTAHSPAILGLLANKVYYSLSPREDELPKILSCKRNEILKRLGFIHSNAVIKLLSKIKVSVYDKNVIDALTNILCSPKIIKDLRHYYVINKAVLAAAMWCPFLLRHVFFKNFLTEKNINEGSILSVSRTYKDTILLAKAVKKRGFSRSIKKIKQVKNLDRMHDRLAGELNKRNIEEEVKRLEDIYGSHLPQPIYPATKKIVPITTISELLLEGQEMQHCVASYARRIIQGYSCIYKVLSPERATLEIRTAGTFPRIVQVKLYRNGQPSWKTMGMVNKWFVANVKNKAA